jgi:hypothetical protein
MVKRAPGYSSEIHRTGFEMARNIASPARADGPNLREKTFR